MTFGKGQLQPKRKRNFQPKAKNVSKTSRKQARGQWQSEQERFGCASRNDEDYDDDDDEDTDDDNEDYDDESKDGDEEIDDDYDEQDGKALKERQLGMEEKQALGMDLVKQEEVRVVI
jgi:hypothetical protein